MKVKGGYSQFYRK